MAAATTASSTEMVSMKRMLTAHYIDVSQAFYDIQNLEVPIFLSDYLTWPIANGDTRLHRLLKEHDWLNVRLLEHRDDDLLYHFALTPYLTLNYLSAIEECNPMNEIFENLKDSACGPLSAEEQAIPHLEESLCEEAEKMNQFHAGLLEIARAPPMLQPSKARICSIVTDVVAAERELLLLKRDAVIEPWEVSMARFSFGTLTASK